MAGYSYLDKGPRLFGQLPFFVSQAVKLSEKDGRCVRAHCVGPVTQLALWQPAAHASVMLLFLWLGFACAWLETRSDNEGDFCQFFLYHFPAAIACAVLLACEVHIAKYSSTWFMDKSARQGRGAWACPPVAVILWLSRVCSVGGSAGTERSEADEELLSGATSEVMSGSECLSDAQTSSFSSSAPSTSGSGGGGGGRREDGVGRKKRWKFSRPMWTKKWPSWTGRSRFSGSVGRSSSSEVLTRASEMSSGVPEASTRSGSLTLAGLSDLRALSDASGEHSGAQFGASGSIANLAKQPTEQPHWCFHVWLLWLLVIDIVTLYSRIQGNTFMGMFLYMHLSGSIQHIVDTDWAETRNEALFIPDSIPLRPLLAAVFCAQIGHYLYGMVYCMPRPGWTAASHRRWAFDQLRGVYAWMEWGRMFEFDIAGPRAERKSITDVIQWREWVNREFQGGRVEVYFYLGTLGTLSEPLDSDFPLTVEWTEADTSDTRKRWNTILNQDKWAQWNERKFNDQPVSVKAYRFATQLTGRPGELVTQDSCRKYEPSKDEFPLSVKWTATRHAYTSLRGWQVKSSEVMDEIAECCSMQLLLEMQLVILQDYRRVWSLLDKYTSQHTGMTPRGPVWRAEAEVVQAVHTLMNDAVPIARRAVSRVFVHGVCYCGAYLYFQVVLAKSLCSGRGWYCERGQGLCFGIGSAFVSMVVVISKVFQILQYSWYVWRTSNRYQTALITVPDQYEFMHNDITDSRKQFNLLFLMMVIVSVFFACISTCIFVKYIM